MGTCRVSSGHGKPFSFCFGGSHLGVKRKLDEEREAERMSCADHSKQTDLRKIVKRMLLLKSRREDLMEVGWDPAQMGALRLIEIWTVQASLPW